jgi:ribonuclease HI
MYEIYTDGSCLGNPGRGGWGVIGKGVTLTGNLRNTTNNVMEMTAVVKALEVCVNYGHDYVRIYTDSNYVKNGITQWIHNWKKNGWKTSSGGDVKNKELWMQIDELRERLNMVEWKWVKAHNGNPLNEAVDKLARESAKILSA